MLGTASHAVRIPGSLYVVGSMTNSDIHLKTIQGDYNSGLDVIRKLKTFRFIYKDDKLKRLKVGIIAQDLQKILPEAVVKNDEGYLAYKNEYITFAMFNAIQELDKMVQKLTEDFKSLVKRVDLIDDKIAAVIKANQVNSDKIKQLEKENKQLEKRINELEKRISKNNHVNRILRLAPQNDGNDVYLKSYS